MKLLQIWNGREAWSRAAQLRKPPKMAYALMGYEELVAAEVSICEKERNAIVIKVSGASEGETITLKAGTPELSAFWAEFNLFLETDSKLPSAPVSMNEWIDAIAIDAANSVCEKDLAAIKPFFHNEKPA